MGLGWPGGPMVLGRADQIRPGCVGPGARRDRVGFSGRVGCGPGRPGRCRVGVVAGRSWTGPGVGGAFGSGRSIPVRLVASPCSVPGHHPAMSGNVRQCSSLVTGRSLVVTGSGRDGADAVSDSTTIRPDCTERALTAQALTAQAVTAQARTERTLAVSAPTEPHRVVAFGHERRSPGAIRHGSACDVSCRDDDRPSAMRSE
jgi:hypothetical protein